MVIGSIVPGAGIREWWNNLYLGAQETERMEAPG